MSKTRISLVSLGLIFIALLAWIAVLPPLTRPNISISVISYTNTTSGIRLAKIIITNSNAAVVFVYQPVIEVPAASGPPKAVVYPAGQAYYHSSYFRWHATLAAGAPAQFTIPTPTNQSPWRLALLADPDVGFARAIKRFLIRQGRRMPYEIQSRWFQNRTEKPDRAGAIAGKSIILR